MKIVTSVVNNPIFIEIQYYTFKKYMKCEYEFIVFNDAKQFPDFTNGGDINIYTQIIDICNKLEIKCINIPNEEHQACQCPVRRCADSMNFILNYQIKNPDKYLGIDSDMFLVDDFNLEDYENFKCAIVLQERDPNIYYFWNGLYYFDIEKMSDLNNFSWNNVNININRRIVYLDVGGMNANWLRKQVTSLPDTNYIRHSNMNEKLIINNIYFIKHLWSCSWDMNEFPKNITNDKLIEFIINDPRNQNGKFFCEIYDNKFLHYRAGGDWERRGISTHFELANKLKDLLLL